MRKPRGSAGTLYGALALTLVFGACTRAAAAPVENLVPDPSFEAPIPSWFSEDGGRDYFAGKEKVNNAAEGSTVLVIAGWSQSGSLISSGPVALTAKSFSASINVRTFGTATAGHVEFALYDLDKKRKLAVFGSVPIDGRGKWTTIRASGKALAYAAAEGALGITVSGPMRGSRVEVDRVGLFPGAKLTDITDTAQFVSFEAESMRTNGKAWKPLGEFQTWYHDFPSGKGMLSGSDGVRDADNEPATFTLNVKAPGTFTLWTRFLRTNSLNHASFTISLKQKGRIVASKEIADDSEAQYGASPLTWVYTPLAAVLQTGAVEVELTRPSNAPSWLARKVDMFALTNLAHYQPKIQDFRAQGYMRFTSATETPFCLLLGIRRHEGPVYNVSRMWTAAGLWAGTLCPEDKRFTLGESSPWVRISDSLSPAQGHNNVTLLATTQSDGAGYLSGPMRGTLEFALGREHQIVKTIPIDQASPRALLTVGADYNADSILTSRDYIAKEQAVVASIASTSRPRATSLDLSVILGLDANLDPVDVVDDELGIVKALGFNGTYTPLALPALLKAFNEAHGLSHVGIWGARPSANADYASDSGRNNLVASWAKIARDFAPTLDRIERAKIFDEPRGTSYETLLNSPSARSAFPYWLKAQRLSPSDLGVGDWNEVVPVGPDRSKVQPRLFYWTGVYRLNAFADMAKAVVAAKKQAGVPDNIKTYSNYDPTWGNDSFTQAGVDPFLTQRNGGFELGWTEDWLGYGVSAEQISDQLALLRAAGAPTHQELGMYVVGVDGPPALQRLRFYEGLAAGVRHFCSYNYGPYYASIDSWGARYDVYRHIADTLHDFGAIDAALNGTTRRKSDVAILYNRTAAIWGGQSTASEQDARYIFWALSHAGYQPEFIPEEDVESGGLSKYKALYIGGAQVRRRSARAVASWILQGGIAFATAGAGSRDEYNQPLAVLDQALGAHSADLAAVADPGRPKYELRSLRSLGTLRTPAGGTVPAVSFNRLCTKETVTPLPGAKVVLKDDSGGPSGVLHTFGKGTALRVAALPGIAYLNDAVKDPAYEVESYHPTRYRTELRDFIAFAASSAHAERIETNAPTVEVVRYDAADRIVLIVTNHGTPVPDFRMKVTESRAFSAYTASGIPIALRALGQDVDEMSFALDAADAVVLTRRPSSASILRPAPRASVH